MPILRLGEERIPIDQLPRTRSITIKLLRSLDIEYYDDLLSYLPFRYEDRSIVASIFSLQEGDRVTVQGTVLSIKSEFTRSRLRIQRAMVEDSSGTIGFTWFNQPFVLNTLHVGDRISAWGEVKKYGALLVFQPEDYEVLRDSDSHTKHSGKIVPIYPETRGLSNKTIREKMQIVLQTLLHTQTPITSEELEQLKTQMEFLPEHIINTYHLPSAYDAYRMIHAPLSMDEVSLARNRLAFDELFTIQLAHHYVKEEWNKERVGNIFHIQKHKNSIQQFIQTLPFSLTSAQERVINDILEELQSEKPMNRFVQGDVGSGKTVVAAIAAYAGTLDKYQTLIMAPTEILAQQHYQTLTKIFANHTPSIALVLGKKIYQANDMDDTSPPIKNRTIKGGRKNKKTKKDSAKELMMKDMKKRDIIIGTHALLNESIDLDRVGLVVIDEQHRFGVRQRAALKDKGIHPHLLTMTATPIPRTVALTLFGELNMSVIDEMPKDRLPVKTYIVTKEKRKSSYDWMRSLVEKNNDQLFIICPLIEESQIESMKSIRAATQEYEHLKKDIFPALSIGLLHGKMKTAEKDEMMQRFKNKELDILISTSVVEVGIDIPNATVIMIEGAERFGLAQLHQLRGRVGRGSKQSYCLLSTTNETKESLIRLQFFGSHTKGIDIAQYDLEHRGAGELYGTKQHGLAELKIASFSDHSLIESVQHAVTYFAKTYPLDTYPLLKERVAAFHTQEISRD